MRHAQSSILPLNTVIWTSASNFLGRTPFLLTHLMLSCQKNSSTADELNISLVMFRKIQDFCPNTWCECKCSCFEARVISIKLCILYFRVFLIKFSCMHRVIGAQNNLTYTSTWCPPPLNNSYAAWLTTLWFWKIVTMT